MASLKYVQTKIALSTGGIDSTISATFDSTPVAGNFIVVSVAKYNNTAAAITASDNKGNTYISSVQRQSTGVNNSGRVAILYANNITSSSTFTVTATAASEVGTRYWCLVITEYSGLHPSAPEDVTNSGGGDVSAGTAAASSGAVSPVGNCLYIGVVSHTDGNITITPTSSGWTQRGEDEDGATNNDINSIDIISSGSQTATWDIGSFEL